jgi:metal-sulfur cluster biosynthetic enzyme
MFIQTEPMPNSADLKFLPGRQVLAEGTLDLRDRTQAEASPLAQRLFAIPGVSGVFFGSDFITVTKEGRDWQVLKPAILGAIMEHFTSGAPVVDAPMASVDPRGDANGKAEDVRQALRRVIDPELGYNIVGLGLIYGVDVGEGGVVRITMTTTTPGCPATSYLMTGARDAASSVQGVEFVDVKLTHEPRWTPEMMSEEAKARFGIRDGGGW